MTAPLRGSSSKPIVGQVLEMAIGMSWGNVDMVGLTSLKVLDAAFKPILIQPAMLSCTPLGEYAQINRLIDGVDNTDDATHGLLLAARMPNNTY